jgi:hypothetical protein
VHPGFLNPVEMLPMPKASGLTSAQIGGTACPWCAVQFGTDAGTPLGPRLRVMVGCLEQWFPRACRPCIRREAARVADLHDETCGRCSRNVYCTDSRALHQLARGMQVTG